MTLAAFPPLEDIELQAARVFLRVWACMAGHGLCDAAGGRESARVYCEWVAAGRPAGMAAFIADHANHPPQLTTPSA